MMSLRDESMTIKSISPCVVMYCLTGGGHRGGGGLIVCYGNYGVGAYGMEWVQHREPERSRIISQWSIQSM